MVVTIDLDQEEAGGKLAPRTDLIGINELILTSGKRRDRYINPWLEFIVVVKQKRHIETNAGQGLISTLESTYNLERNNTLKAMAPE
jgi:hypothetical protein